MICTRPLGVALLAAGLALAAPSSSPAQPPDRGARDRPNEPNAPPDTALDRASLGPGRSFAVPGRSSSRPASGAAGEAPGGGWKFGPVGIAAALAAVGALSWAAQRFNLNLGLGTSSTRLAGRLGVVGSVRLGSKQALHLVRIGDRVLIVGTGPASAPQTLGEVTDPAELTRLIPHRTNPIAPSSRAANPTSSSGSAPIDTGRQPLARLDQRIGDDE